MARRSYGARIVFTEDTLTPRVEEFPDVVDRFAGDMASAFAPRVQSAARMNAPWTDRTGNARNGLFASAFHSSGQHGIDLYHSMPYGIWLEVRHEGRFAIIEPTIQEQGRQIMEAFRSAMGSM